jgi:hypothetical protein
VTEERIPNNELALRHYQDRPLGCPPAPDPSAVTKEELERRRETIDRLRELARKAEKGTKKALPEIREILQGRPELAWRFMEFARLAESRFVEAMTKERLRRTGAIETSACADERRGRGGEPIPLGAASRGEDSHYLATDPALRRPLREQHEQEHERGSG